MSLNPQPQEQERHLHPVQESEHLDESTLAIQESANWFYWLVGLSVVNTILMYTGMNLVFIFGLGATQILDGMGSVFGPIGGGLALGLSVVVWAFYGAMGFLAGRGQAWAFILGMAVYAGDALLLVLFSDWISVAVHAYVMWRLSSGMMASLRR